MFSGLDTVTTAFDSTKSNAERASAALSGVASIMAGASQMKVAALDQEIAAEKKRDGQSAASVAKITALEKKKDKEKKKAFEVDKKLKMATTVISTASAVMQAAPNFPLMIAIGAMGAASLAIIAGTSYQSASSGDSGVASAAPSKLEVGSRNNTVDLASANNAGGELAYARGESGVGTGMDNYKPTSAFAGYKGRAAGGYLVGEQGPEVFMPETPGNIIPSGQETSGTTNVNFSISAVDATGVEELLINQRGNIIAMLREAANEHGQLFLEGVQDKSY